MNSINLTPFPVLQTGRLLLRQLKSSDDIAIYALRSNDDVNKYLDRSPARSIDDARNFIQSINDIIQRNESLYWAITLQGNDQLVGTICLFDFSADHLQAEIGFELLPAFQEKGIMQEAASLIIDFAFQQLGFHSIKAYTHADNKSSKRLLEKLNFERDQEIEHAMIFILKRR